jgi:hypothetical protein
MKKIIILTTIIFLVFTGLSFAAQKTITTYIRAGNMATYLPTVDPGDFVVNGPGITGSLSGNNLSMGNDTNNVAGSYIYGGDSDIAFCVQGKCVFGIGVRVYFEFNFKDKDSSSDSTAFADGFSFFVINGLNNNRNSTGGSPSLLSMGELLGYGGPGNTDHLGLQPPKIGIEVDTYPNTGTGDVCSSSSRSDADNNNHMALMLWGDNLAGTCTVSGNNYPKSTFDDNRHGSGGSGGYPPVNAKSGDGLVDYYAGPKNGSYNWLEDGVTHLFRLEITRSNTPVSGNYAYNIKAWVDCPSCTAAQLNTFQDLTVPYNNETVSPKRINRTVSLTAADHQAFNTMLFGFGYATGGAYETVTFQNFHVYFPRSSCGYGTNPTSASPSSAAQAGNINVLATAGCAWTAASDSAWLTITSGGSGTGNSIVPVVYNVTANTGPERTGHITIGDNNGSQVFTVTQAAGPPTCTLTAGANIVPYNNTNSLTWSVSGGTATTAAWTTSPGGTCGSPNPAGGSCTTAAQTTAGQRTYTLTVSNALGSNSCSATFYVGCQNYRVYNGLGGTRDFYMNSGCRDGITSNSEITQAANRLDPGETIQAYASAGTCTTALGIALDYNDAMNVDIAVNGGDGDCQVNLTGNHTATDR